MSSRQDRDQRAASLMVDAIFQPPLAPQPPARWLVVDDPLDDVSRAIDDAGASCARWSRRAPPKGATGATAEPPSGPFDAAAIRLDRSRPAMGLVLELVASRLPAGAPIWIYGANDEGARSAHNHLGAHFEAPETVQTRRHCRLLRAIRGEAPARGALAEFREDARLALPGGEAALIAYPGVFARGALDPASELLLQALEKFDAAPERILDFGCGFGALLAGAAQRWPGASLYGLDVDAVAVAAAREGIPQARIACGDGWYGLQGLPHSQFDLILSNPPLHKGRDLDLSVLDALIAGTPDHLRPGGQLVLVTQRQRSVREGLDAKLRQPRVLAEDGRFRVWLAGLR